MLSFFDVATGVGGAEAPDTGVGAPDVGNLDIVVLGVTASETYNDWSSSKGSSSQPIYP